MRMWIGRRASPAPSRLELSSTPHQQNPVPNVFGFQFVINYNASAFVAQGDPDPSATPSNPLGLCVDGAASTVNFGAQTAPGTVNWAGLIAANKGLSDSHDRAAGGKCWFGSCCVHNSRSQSNCHDLHEYPTG